jgi:hypothetical protein
VRTKERGGDMPSARKVLLVPLVAFGSVIVIFGSLAS